MFAEEYITKPLPLLSVTNTFFPLVETPETTQLSKVTKTLSSVEVAAAKSAGMVLYTTGAAACVMVTTLSVAPV